MTQKFAVDFFSNTEKQASNLDNTEWKTDYSALSEFLKIISFFITLLQYSWLWRQMVLTAAEKKLWMGFLWVFERKVLDAVDCCLHMQKHIFFHCKQRTFSFIILTNGTYYFIEFNF